MIDPEELMRLAIEVAERGIRSGQTPFGCAIARGDEVVAAAHNRVLANLDITAHAEIEAIRAACRATGTVHLSQFSVASTCEPCPMCTGALHWARVGTVYYGASIADAARVGFNELRIPAGQILALGESPIEVVGDILADQCRRLFEEWAVNGAGRSY